jgi:hypothetical protein
LNRKFATVAICCLNPAFAIASMRFVKRSQGSPVCTENLNPD